MTDLVESGGAPAPDANVSQTEELNADAEALKTGNEADPSPAVTDEDDSSKPSKGVGKRIDELTRNWREAERRAERHERALFDLLQQQRAEPTKPPPPEPTTHKTLADFEFDEAKYQAHLFEQAEARGAAAAERKLKEYQERETNARRSTEFAAREREFAKSTADYFEVTRSPSLNITQSMAEAVAESEEAAAVLYYLGKNPDVTDRIAALSPLAAAREIGRIEAKLLTEREKVKAPLVSKAPPPTPKLEAVEPAVDKDPDQMPIEEWRRMREKQLARRK